MDEVQHNRRIGLGVMGWSDLLIQLGIRMTARRAGPGRKIMEFITRVGRDESARLAEERGRSRTGPEHLSEGAAAPELHGDHDRPTGTISIIAGCSSGIEPSSPWLQPHRWGPAPDVRESALRGSGTEARVLQPGVDGQGAEHGTLEGLGEVPEDVRRVFVTAHEIPPDWHVRMQAAFQKYTDNGVSKTINLPNSATVEDVAKAYQLAYDLGCLGITVFRDGCKSAHGGQVLHVGTGGASKETPELEEHEGWPRADDGQGAPADVARRDLPGRHAPRTGTCM